MNLEILESAQSEEDFLGLPAGLIMAICQVESSMQPWAWNPEPPYRYLVNARTRKPFRRLTAAEIASEKPPRDFPRNPHTREARDAEWWGQAASWGVMQVMGAVAREYGFKRSFPALCDPSVGIRWGALHLKKLMRFKRRHGISGVIAAYNAGSPRRSGGVFVNQRYVDKVTRAWAKYQ